MLRNDRLCSRFFEFDITMQVVRVFNSTKCDYSENTFATEKAAQVKSLSFFVKSLKRPEIALTFTFKDFCASNIT